MLSLYGKSVINTKFSAMFNSRGKGVEQGQSKGQGDATLRIKLHNLYIVHTVISMYQVLHNFSKLVKKEKSEGKDCGY